MYLRPSRHGGFARNDAESAYPELWAGLTGAWVPALGGSVSSRVINNVGTVIEDLSGFGPGMFGDGPTEIRGEVAGGPSLQFAATTLGYVEMSHPGGRLFRANGATIVVHKQKTDGTNRNATIFGNVAGVAAAICRLYAPDASGNAVFEFGGNTGTNELSISGLTFGDDVWVCRAGTRGLYVWQNGVLVGSSSTPVTFSNNTTTWRWNGGVSTSSDLCRSKVMLTFDRELSDQDALLLSRDPLAPFVVKHPLKLIAGGGGAILDNDISQSLNLGQDATPTIERQVSASSTLALAGLAVAEIGVEKNVESELGFTDLAEGFVFPGDIQHVSHDLGLTDSAVGDNASTEEPTSSLALIQSVSVVGPTYVDVHVIMGLEHGAGGSIGVPWLPIEVEHSLGLSQLAGRARPQSVTSTLSLTGAAFRRQEVQSTLSLVQTVAGGEGIDLSTQNVNLSHVVLVNAAFLRSFLHNNFLQQSLTYFIDNSCARKEYNRYQGEGEGDGIEEKPLLFNSDFVLESLSGPKLIVRLRSPEMDDRDRSGFNRVNRETRGGELNVFSDPAWPNINTLLVTITALKQTKIEELQEFLLTTLGQQIKLQDWKGRSWAGVITTPGDVATEDERNAWTMSFEFEGEPYEGQAIDDRIAFDQYVLPVGPVEREGDPGALSLDQYVSVTLESP